MKSKSPFKKSKCGKAWAAWEKPYLKKPGGKKEAARERGEFYCDKGKIKMRPLDDGDMPMSDAAIKEMKRKNNKSKRKRTLEEKAYDQYDKGFEKDKEGGSGARNRRRGNRMRVRAEKKE
jgi:hypothetical protein|tara:strand:- start:38 stop:397 length:360 start_codon:yes stop_codon:yes gene_type:complete